MIKQDPSVNKSCSTGMMYKTSLLQYTYIMEKSEFKRKRGLKSVPGFGLAVDLRSTAGRLGN